MKMVFCFLCCFAVFSSLAQPPAVSIIPAPVEVKTREGMFTLNGSSAISVSHADVELQRVADMLSAKLAVATGFKMPVRAPGVMTTNIGNILLQLNKQPENILGNEGYRLTVSATQVTVTANKPAGLFYGIQSFIQLLPAAIESKTVIANVAWQAPAVEILDYPRFGWRGLMFDVSRHFFTKEEVKQFIDEMARYKYNVMHWHLTDDEGWRIEIKSYPKLTQVGAWNVKREGTFGNFVPPADDEKRDYGGFYTQEDIKEVVAYASERFVNILPEVDVPGHSLATIASYPELSCTPGAEKYRVRSGEKIMNWHSGGFTALVDNTLCPANEKVYTFLDKVFTEVAALFPFEYIHMGGDECAKNFWEKNPQVLALMKKEKLKDMHEVQSYFVKRVSKIVTAKGKKLMGWDEILEGGLPASAAVMSWRGTQGGIEAAKLGHEVVMTPNQFLYIDFMQGDKAIEPPVYSSLRMSKSYSYEPVPAGVDAKLIKGGQGNLWTEQIYNQRHQQYMTWPRGFAIAEVFWSPKEKRDWNGFVPRVENHFLRFDAAGIKYSPAMYDPVVVAKKTPDNKIMVELQQEVQGLDVHYSFDNSFPDQYYPKYAGAVVIPVDAAAMKLIAYRNGKPVGRMMVVPVSELKTRAGIK
jgi:hexosaminidase